MESHGRMSKDVPPRGSPLVTAMIDGPRRILASVEEGRTRGSLTGMTVTHVQSLVPKLFIADAPPHDDKAALDRLSMWCTMYSPLVTPGVFTLSRARPVFFKAKRH
jgi:hypothetical protein